jgi:adenylate cyclase
MLAILSSQKAARNSSCEASTKRVRLQEKVSKSRFQPSELAYFQFSQNLRTITRAHVAVFLSRSIKQKLC